MRNLSLVCFTLLTQSAIGLVWVTVLSRWLGESIPADISRIPLLVALVVSGLGLLMALAHLAQPRLAPHALRNIGISWLSREVLLVQIFIGAVVVLILLSLLNVVGGVVVIEAVTCLLGGGALFAMMRVYMLRTVPIWNTPATYLEFLGSAMLLGGAMGLVVLPMVGTTYSGWNTALLVSSIAIVSGLVLKIAAIFPGLAAERAIRDQTWTETGAAPLSTSNILMARLLLFLVGSVLVMAALSQTGPGWLWVILCLVCFGGAEVLGRIHFYQSYRRVGL